MRFQDDVQPILQRNCYRCHGTRNQEGGLQLNSRSAAMSVADSQLSIITPGEANDSLLIQRVSNDDAGDVMPPDGSPLSPQEIAILRDWIDQGADWPDAVADPKHWAYEPLQRPEVPPVDPASNSINPIDLFVSARLKASGLTASPPLDRRRLLRRASLALIGLPPTPQQIESFVNDVSPDAFLTAVNQLLDSPRYGERWAIPWLDAARYADSNGFQADQIRDNWAYRDWVIRAFNNDMPINQFIVDQIAGDLHPNATLQQKIATGFHRMTTCNVEAGVHPEANRVNQVVDRVNTTATVFLGTTMECAQCHDHKYDPFTQKDYYRLFAYFNNTPLEVEQTSGVTWDFFGPTMPLPMDDQRRTRRDSLEQQLTQCESQRKELTRRNDALFTDWVDELRTIDPAVSGWGTAIPSTFRSTGGEDYQIESDGSVLLSGSVPDKADYELTFPLDDRPIRAVRLELLTDDRIPGKGPGRGDKERTNVVLHEFTCSIRSGDDVVPVKLTSPAADFSQSGWDVGGTIDGDPKTGWAIAPQFGKPHWARYVFAQPVASERDGDQLVVGLHQHYGNGRVAAKPRITFYYADPSFLDIDPELIALAAKEPSEWSDKQRGKLREAFDQRDAALTRLDAKIRSLKKQIDGLKPDTTLVMMELPERRETFVLKRGDYEQPMEKVTPGTPEAMPLDASIASTGDRMELALWLTSPSNPLTARVMVNRWWAEFFGRGLVNTLEDFGTQADAPSHPLLLDWLASELIESGWSMKHIHRLIVTSSTFQQESRITDDQAQRDPQNRLLSRGPRFRLSAEIVRDNALAISGLLSGKMFGPPVMPFQPDNLWRSIGRNQPKWKTAIDEDRFRRGLYVIWKRAAPYPSFITFDAPDRGSCTVSRGRTNTPLQALTLMNDPAYAEMSLAFADRILTECPSTSDDERLHFAMQLAVARRPSERELEILRRLLDEQRTLLSEQPAMIQQRTQGAGNAIVVQYPDRPELAAWFAVANALLNLDETISM
ncbi:MAG: DUF1553 domain-containing protein [Pirellulaceae bacterium]